MFNIIILIFLIIAASFLFYSIFFLNTYPKYYSEFKYSEEYLKDEINGLEFKDKKNYPNLKPYIKSVEHTFQLQNVKNIFSIEDRDYDKSIKEIIYIYNDFVNNNIASSISKYLYNNEITENILIKKNNYIKKYLNEEIKYKRNNLKCFFSFNSSPRKSYDIIDKIPFDSRILFFNHFHVLYNTFCSYLKDCDVVSYVDPDKSVALRKCLFHIISKVNGEDDFINIPRIEYTVKLQEYDNFSISSPEFSNVVSRTEDYVVTVYYNVIDAEKMSVEDLAVYFAKSL